MRRTPGPGLVEGRLAPCPSSPNCVSTQSGEGRSRMDPLPFSESPAQARAHLLEILGALRRVTVVTAEESYIYAECRSAVLRFVDDLEIAIDAEAKVIHFRSASRLGYSDLGVNRARVAEIMRRYRQNTQDVGH
ncbi:MAG: DUF1499 domain-containing protein [Candidatus Schekmanbacteria bacterium]|nr:DUF1499 domain-containing protein [Candidatus Schekmanbacteria bacterium]